ncbi:MAG: hypothetical protein [Siphoviridae sp. ctpQM7]|nr:MAG: hypothetical protein [Siphoviridae sp. ctpQM7]
MCAVWGSCAGKGELSRVLLKKQVDFLRCRMIPAIRDIHHAPLRALRALFCLAAVAVGGSHRKSMTRNVPKVRMSVSVMQCANCLQN